MVSKYMMDVMDMVNDEIVKCNDTQLAFDIVEMAVSKGCSITMTIRPGDGYMCVTISRENVDDQKEEA